MGFTAAMDEVDDAKFSGQPLPSSARARRVRRSAPGPATAQEPTREGDREEVRYDSADGPRAVRLRGLTDEARAEVQAEAQLLASLEVAGITAAPAVLELEEEGYQREWVPLLKVGSGRRAAGVDAPPTGERHALARAREALDALVDALHERGWVLGARSGQGLGIRPDGSVLVLDLQGLRRGDDVTARQDDRAWVDSVLRDRDRTLRRRVHRTESGVEDPSWTLGDLPAAGSAERAEQAPDPGPGVRPRPRRAPATSPVRSVASASRRSADGGATDRTRARGRTSSGRRGAARRVALPIREVLHQPRLRRIALLSGAFVLLCGSVAGLGAWWGQDRSEPGPVVGSPTAGSTMEPAPLPAPQIEDPQMLVAELAGARHAYVTGLSDEPSSAPGSIALEEDRRLRDAYEGTTVSGGGPVVHSAEVIEQAEDGETAVVHAETSMEEVQVMRSGGEATTVPGTEAAAVELVLRWDGRRWLILSAEPPDVGGRGDTTEEDVTG